VARLLSSRAKGVLELVCCLPSLLAVVATFLRMHNGGPIDFTAMPWDGPLALVFHVDALSLMFALMGTGLGAAVLLYSIGYMAHEQAAMHCFNQWPYAWGATMMWVGTVNRVNYGMNRNGGVNRDIADSQAVLNTLDEMEREITRTVIPIFLEDRTVQSRCKGVGILIREHALSMGGVGPLARAWGVEQDIRRSAPYSGYDRFEFNVPVETAGDVQARLVVHALEMVESCRILRQALSTLPEGPFHATLPTAGKFKVPAGTAISRVEAPRGEVLYQITANGTDIPERVRVRTPTFMNMATVRFTVLGQELADSPLIQASCDPCYSCTDR